MILAADLLVSRFVHYAGVLGLFGILLFPVYVKGPVDPRDAQRLRGLSIGAALLGLIGGAGWFVFTTASMAGDLASAADPTVLMQMVTATDFGPLWLARLGMIAAALIVLATSRRRIGLLPLCLSALALASIAGAGHARVTQGWPGALHLSADAAHLLAAGAWLGGLIPLSLAVNRWLGKVAPDDPPPHRVLAQFSGMGSLAVAVLVLTGVINSWFLVGSVPALWSTLYGRLLTAKVVVFLVMAGLAAANRFWITPALANGVAGRADQLRALRRHVFCEQVLGLIVVAIVGLLGTLQTAA